MQLRHLAKRKETAECRQEETARFLARLSTDDLETTAGETRSAKLAVDFYLFLYFPQDLKIGFALL